MSRVVMNITTSARWRKRPVGIVRVERGLLASLYRHFGHDIVPLCLDRDNEKFGVVDWELVERILADDWLNSPDPERDSDEVHGTLGDFAPSIDDRLITVGLDWSQTIPTKVGELYESRRNMIGFCHDLIPVTYPEYAPGAESILRNHFLEMGKYARSMGANSQSTKLELEDFWKRESLAGAPPVIAVPLAAVQVPAELPPLDEYDKKKFDQTVKANPYVLYVSTVEARKNHQLLLHIWRQLYRERGDKCPTLVLVGADGWCCHDVAHQIRHLNASRAERIVWLESVSESLLHHLYRNALFTVFPSLYEGWGLGASEALAHGKVCVVSSAGALQEATSGIMPAYHPHDYPGWKKEIDRLLDDAAYREALEMRVAARSPLRSWKEFGDDFIAAFLTE